MSEHYRRGDPETGMFLILCGAAVIVSAVIATVVVVVL